MDCLMNRAMPVNEPYEMFCIFSQKFSLYFAALLTEYQIISNKIVLVRRETLYLPQCFHAFFFTFIMTSSKNYVFVQFGLHAANNVKSKYE